MPSLWVLEGALEESWRWRQWGAPRVMLIKDGWREARGTSTYYCESLLPLRPECLNQVLVPSVSESLPAGLCGVEAALAVITLEPPLAFVAGVALSMAQGTLRRPCGSLNSSPLVPSVSVCRVVIRGPQPGRLSLPPASRWGLPAPPSCGLRLVRQGLRGLLWSRVGVRRRWRQDRWRVGSRLGEGRQREGWLGRRWSVSGGRGSVVTSGRGGWGCLRARCDSRR